MLALSLKQKLSLVEKMIALQKNVREKRKATADQAATLRPLLQLLIQRTKELQLEVSIIIYQLNLLMKHLPIEFFFLIPDRERYFKEV